MSERNIDIAWAAGLFEGEGCITCLKPDGGRNPYARISLELGSTDLDVVERFASIVGVGNVVKRATKQRDHHKDLWRWSIGSKNGVLHVLDLLRPHLGSRRSKASDDAIAYINERLGAGCVTYEVKGL